MLRGDHAPRRLECTVSGSSPHTAKLIFSEHQFPESWLVSVSPL